MKTKFNNSELTHVWANKQQTHGNGSNMFFEYDTIYSYGHHFKIAKHVKNYLGQDAVFMNNKSYSNTTHKHQSLVRRAIPQNVPTFNVVSFFDNIETSTLSHKENITSYIKNAEIYKDKTIKASSLKMTYLNNLNNEMYTINKYCTFFNIDTLMQFDLQERYNTLNIWFFEYSSSNELNQWKEKQKQKELKVIEKAKEKAKESIELFRQFKISSIYANLGHYLLRFNAETNMIETSGGVKMPKPLFISAYKRLMNNELLKGQHVGDYTFNGFDGEIVSVGCHRIPMTEIKNVVSCLP